MTSDRDNLEEKKRATLYEKLVTIKDEIPLNQYTKHKDFFIRDEEVINLVKRKIIEPYKSRKIVGEVIRGESSIISKISPIVKKAEKVKREYDQITKTKKFDPEREIFGETENLIVTELEGILNVKESFENHTIVTERYENIADKFFGLGENNSKRIPIYAARNALPFATIAIYFFGPNSSEASLGQQIVGYPLMGIMGGIFGALISTGIASCFIHPRSEVIEYETNKLEKQAKFLDDAIREVYRK